MLNHITIMGRLTHQPVLHVAQSGIPVCSFSIACQRGAKGTDGNQAVDFVDVVSFRKTAEFVNRWLSKGRMAVVEGRLQMRDWTDRDGNKRRSAEIVANSVHFGDSKPQDQGAPAPYSGSNPSVPESYVDGRTSPPPVPYSGSPAASGWSEIDDSGGELPF